MKLPFPSLASAVFVCFAGPVLAGNTWDGGGATNNWSNSLNWNPDGVPVANTAVIFAGLVDPAPVVDSAVSVSGVTFDSTAGAFTIQNSAGSSLNIGAGGVTNNDTQTQTFATPVTLSASQTWNAAAGDITATDTWTVDTAAGSVRSLTVSGANDVRLTGVHTGQGTVVKNGTGTLFYGNASSTAGGTVQLNTGTLALTADGPFGSTIIRLEDGGTFRADGAARFVGNRVHFAAPGPSLGGTGVTIGGNLNLTLHGEVTVVSSSKVLVTNTAATAITGPIVGSGTFLKAGTRPLVIGGSLANTLTGVLQCNETGLELNKIAGVNATAGEVQIFGTGFLRSLAADQLPNAGLVRFMDNGYWELNGMTETIGTLRFEDNTLLMGPGTLTCAEVEAVGAAVNGSFGADLGLSADTTVLVDSAGGLLLLSGRQPGAGSLIKTGPGTLSLANSGVNTHTGVLRVNEGRVRLVSLSGGTILTGSASVGDGIGGAESDVLEVSLPNAMAPGAPVIINATGLLELKTAEDGCGLITLNGGRIDAENAELTLTNGLMVPASAVQSAVIAHTGTGSIAVNTAQTIIVEDSPALLPDAVWSARLTGSGSLTKLGAGTLRFSGTVAAANTGTLTVSAGTVEFFKSAGTPAVAGNVAVNGTGVLQLRASNQIPDTATVSVAAPGSLAMDAGVAERIAALSLTGSAITGDGTIDASVNVVTSPATAEIAATFDASGGSRTLSVPDGAAVPDLLLSGAVVNGQMTKTGAGLLRLTGSSPNTVSFFATGGIIELAKSPGVNAYLTNCQFQNSTLRLTVDDQMPDNGMVTVAGGGILDMGGRMDSVGTLAFLAGGDLTFNGGRLVVLNAVTSAAASNPSLIPAGGILDLGGDTLPVDVADGAAAPDLDAGAALTNGTLLKQGPGTLRVTGAAAVSGVSLMLNAGTLDAGADLAIGPGRTFTMNGGRFTGTLVNNGTFIFNGGSFDGLLIGSGQVILNADFNPRELFLGSPLTVAAGRTLSSQIGMVNQSTLTLTGGTLGGSSIANDGIIAGYGTIGGTFGFANNGIVNVTGGNLILSKTGNNDNFGLITLPAPLRFTLEQPLFNDGLLLLSGGVADGPAVLTNYDLGIIRGTGMVSGPLLNSGGLIHATGSGVLSLSQLTGNNSGGELRADDGATLFLNSNITSSGTIVLQGPNATFGPGRITNTGTVRGSGRMTSGVLNSGTIRAEDGTLTLSSADNTNPAAGRIEAGAGAQILFSRGLAANDGIIALSGGSFDNNNNILANTGRMEGHGTIRTGGLTSSGTISTGGDLDLLGPLTNNGTVSITGGSRTRFYGPVNGPGSYPGAGTAVFLNTFSPGASPAAVTFGGNLEFSADATLVAELAGPDAGTGYDQLTITGNARLAGHLAIPLLNGYLPVPGTAFTLISAAAITGTFAGAPDNAVIGSGTAWFRLRYERSRVTLTTLDPAANITSFTSAPGTGPHAGQTVHTVTATGIPGLAYQMELSPDLITWTPVATTVAPPSGVLAVSAPTSGSRLFFRLRP